MQLGSLHLLPSNAGAALDMPVLGISKPLGTQYTVFSIFCTTRRWAPR